MRALSTLFNTVILVPLVLVTSSARASCPRVSIGLYAEEQGVICSDFTAEGNPTELHLILQMPPTGPPVSELAITLANIPQDSEQGDVVVTWQIPPSSGDLGSELVWSFDPPITVADIGPVFTLGSLQFTPLDPGWIGDNHVIELVGGRVIDIYLQNQWAGEQFFTFNCYYDCNCIPPGHPIYCISALDILPQPGQSIEGDFVLDFRVESWTYGEGSGWEPYSGNVTVNDSLMIPIDNLHFVNLPLTTGDLEAGDELHIEIDLANAGATSHASLCYPVGTTTGIPNLPTHMGNLDNLSAIKSLY